MKHILTMISAIALLALTMTAAGAKPAGVTPYPLKTCIVTDNTLGSMGDEQRIVHDGREIKFCCKPCIAKFRKNPAKYLAKIKK